MKTDGNNGSNLNEKQGYNVLISPRNKQSIKQKAVKLQKLQQNNNKIYGMNTYYNPSSAFRTRTQHSISYDIQTDKNTFSHQNQNQTQNDIVLEIGNGQTNKQNVLNQGNYKENYYNNNNFKNGYQLFSNQKKQQNHKSINIVSRDGNQNNLNEKFGQTYGTQKFQSINYGNNKIVQHSLQKYKEQVQNNEKNLQFNFGQKNQKRYNTVQGKQKNEVNLPPLQELQNFSDKNKYLEGVQSNKNQYQVKQKLGDFDGKLQANLQQQDIQNLSQKNIQAGQYQYSSQKSVFNVNNKNSENQEKSSQPKINNNQYFMQQFYSNSKEDSNLKEAKLSDVQKQVHNDISNLTGSDINVNENLLNKFTQNNLNNKNSKSSSTQKIQENLSQKYRKQNNFTSNDYYQGQQNGMQLKYDLNIQQKQNPKLPQKLQSIKQVNSQIIDSLNSKFNNENQNVINKLENNYKSHNQLLTPINDKKDNSFLNNNSNNSELIQQNNSNNNKNRSLSINQQTNTVENSVQNQNKQQNENNQLLSNQNNQRQIDSVKNRRSISLNQNYNQQVRQFPHFNKQDIDENEIQKDMLKESEIPKILESKVSQKGTGIIEAYGANTHQGLVRDYNEDRVSIILNIVRPPNKTHIKDWPACSFFAVYDGHGGAACADFLRDNLHQFIVKDEMFPQDPVQSIKNGFAKAEKFCLEKAEYTGMMDKSGSCAIVAFLIENKCYIANVGDSRAILSSQLGKKVNDLSTDHKPSIESEQLRIKSLGGRIYQTEIPLPSYMIQPGKPNTIKGPHRVHPGRLAVSRTFGDPESKLPRYGGIPGVISSEPEIFQFDINEQQDDFILLGCDGIFDTLDSEQAIKIIWEQKQKIIQQIQKTQQLSPYLKRKQMNNQENNNKFLNQFVGLSINHLLKTCLLRKSFDNVTVLLIAFPNLAKFFSLQNQSHSD